MAVELWTESRLIDGLALGPPVCVDNPCDYHEAEECGNLVVEYRDVLNQGAWLDPAGEWVLLSCCGSVEQDCCEGKSIPAAIRCVVVIGAATTIYTATHNGSYWIIPGGQYALRCNSGTWEIGRDEGGTLVWYTADGRCDPDFFQGYTFADPAVSVSFVASFESTACEVWGYVQDLYLPDCITVGDPACDISQDCCDDIGSWCLAQKLTTRLTLPKRLNAVISRVGAGDCELEDTLDGLSFCVYRRESNLEANPCNTALCIDNIWPDASWRGGGLTENPLDPPTPGGVCGISACVEFFCCGESLTACPTDSPAPTFGAVLNINGFNNSPGTDCSVCLGTLLNEVLFAVHGDEAPFVWESPEFTVPGMGTYILTVFE